MKPKSTNDYVGQPNKWKW